MYRHLLPDPFLAGSPGPRAELLCMKPVPVGLAAGLVALGIVNAQSQKPAVAPTYERDIRPVLIAQCVGCHNRTTAENKALSGGLALDERQAFVGPKAAVVPGKPDVSELIRRLEA